MCEIMRRFHKPGLQFLKQNFTVHIWLQDQFGKTETLFEQISVINCNCFHHFLELRVMFLQRGARATIL